MAGPTAHLVFSGKIFFVDKPDHAKHFARCLFGRLVILLPFILRVTVNAGDAERAADRLHGRHEPFGRFAFENIHVFEHSFSRYRAMKTELLSVLGELRSFGRFLWARRRTLNCADAKCWYRD